jgi:DNA-binding NarL/FixJ family response regulator
MTETLITPTTSEVTIVIAVHVRVYRDGLVSALNGRNELRVVGAADDGASTFTEVTGRHPDVVLIDVTMPGALDAIQALRSTTLTKVIAFAVDEAEARIVTCIEAGASGYVTCAASIDGVETVIRHVVRDEFLCSPRLAATLLRRVPDRATEGPHALDPRLTRREDQVLRLIRDGLSNKEIAGKLNIAEATVKTHVHRLLEKLEASTRAQAAARAGHLARSQVGFDAHFTHAHSDAAEISRGVGRDR